MTTYFNPTEPTDLQLLVTSVRQHSDLESVAGDTEADVIAHFTSQGRSLTDWLDNRYVSSGYPLGDGVVVALRNFNPDASACTDADLKMALKRTIADVISWRCGKRADANHLQSVSTAVGTNRVPRADAVYPFPPGDWWYRLKRWDIRPVIYAL